MDEVRGTGLAMAVLRERAQSCIRWVEVPNPAFQYKLLVCGECSDSKPQTKQESNGRRSLARRVGSIIIILIIVL